MTIKSFGKFLDEARVRPETGYPSAEIQNKNFFKNKMDRREVVNRELDIVTAKRYLTPYLALHAISKTLSIFGIVLPKYNFLNPAAGEQTFKVRTYSPMGQNLDGTFDPPKSKEGPDYYVYFSYNMDKDGFTEVYAELTDIEGVREIQGYSPISEENVNELAGKGQLRAIAKHYGAKFRESGNWNDLKKHNRAAGLSKFNRGFNQQPSVKGKSTIKEERIVELSNKLIARYSRAASNDRNQAGYEQGMNDTKHNFKKPNPENDNRLRKRAKGSELLANRIAKEDIQEIALNLIQRYAAMKKADAKKKMQKAQQNESNTPRDREYGKTSLRKIYTKGTPGQK